MPLCWPLLRDKETGKFFNCYEGDPCPCCGCCSCSCDYCIKIGPQGICDVAGSGTVIPTSWGADYVILTKCVGPREWDTIAKQADGTWLMSTDFGNFTAAASVCPPSGGWTFVDGTGTDQCDDNLNIPDVKSVTKVKLADAETLCCFEDGPDGSVIPDAVVVHAVMTEAVSHDTRTGGGCNTYDALDPTWGKSGVSYLSSFSSAGALFTVTNVDTGAHGPAVGGEVFWDSTRCRWAVSCSEGGATGAARNRAVWGPKTPDDPTGTYDDTSFAGMFNDSSGTEALCSGEVFGPVTVTAA